jgi:hypothetical protein
MYQISPEEPEDKPRLVITLDQVTVDKGPSGSLSNSRARTSHRVGGMWCCGEIVKSSLLEYQSSISTLALCENSCRIYSR